MTDTARIVLARRPNGPVVAEDFRIETVPLAAPGEGQVLLQTLFLSLDPYMRGRMDARESYAPAVEIGATMVGETICEVVESRASSLAPGDIVNAYTGWQSHAVVDAANMRKVEAGGVPLSALLGVLGMPGFTAWAGLRNIGKPKAGETVVVAAATGPVGSVVGQMARIEGARAVGIAGGPEKCAYLRDALGFDAALDHRAPTFRDDLEAACLDGVDVYFENVGGAVFEAVMPLLNPFARVPVCGLIAQYETPGASDRDRLPSLMRDALTKSLTIRGFIQTEFAAQRNSFVGEMKGLIESGAVKYREDIVGGLENAPEAFMGLLKGRNFGKLVIRVA